MWLFAFILFQSSANLFLYVLLPLFFVFHHLFLVYRIHIIHIIIFTKSLSFIYLKEDYIKLKPVLLCSLLSSLVDPEDSIAAFSYHLITKQIFIKFPKLIVANFVEIMSILNGYLDHSMVKKEYGVGVVDINLSGCERRKVM